MLGLWVFSLCISIIAISSLSDVVSNTELNVNIRKFCNIGRSSAFALAFISMQNIYLIDEELYYSYVFVLFVAFIIIPIAFKLIEWLYSSILKYALFWGIVSSLVMLFAIASFFYLLYDFICGLC